MKLHSCHSVLSCILCMFSLLVASCSSEHNPRQPNSIPIELGAFSSLASKFSQYEIEKILIVIFEDQIEQAQTTLRSVLPSNPRYLLHLEGTSHVPFSVLAIMKRTETVEDYSLGSNKVEYVVCSIRSVYFKSSKELSAEVSYVYKRQMGRYQKIVLKNTKDKWIVANRVTLAVY
jgi:hypothetical protein